MIFPRCLALPVTESSQTGDARRLITRLAVDTQLDAAACARVSLIVTELATNFVKHARAGELVAHAFVDKGGAGLVIHAVDQGPGMANVARCMEDGFSTAGSPGNGLGALRRLSDWCEVYSLPGSHTVIAVGVRAGLVPVAPLAAGGLFAPCPGELVCGDSGLVMQRGEEAVLVLADGLGHGPFAADASREAVAAVSRSAAQAPSALMREVHLALKKTRGAAIAIARIDSAAHTVQVCGVGNITVVLARPGGIKTLPSANGTIGHIIPRVLEDVTLPWTGRETLVMHSDGLHAGGPVYDLPGVWARPPAVLAGLLYARCKRVRDDVSVLAARGIHAP